MHQVKKFVHLLNKPIQPYKMDKKLELAKKLKALAEKGVGGEKLNAETILKDFLAKHNISLDELESEKESDYFFQIKEEEEQLFIQIVARVRRTIKVYGRITAVKIKEFKLKGNFFITCTASEYFEIESMNHVYQRLYKKELDVFYHAFLTANNLLASSENPKSYDDLTDEEKDKYDRGTAMAENIKSETHRKQIHG